MFYKKTPIVIFLRPAIQYIESLLILIMYLKDTFDIISSEKILWNHHNN